VVTCHEWMQKYFHHPIASGDKGCTVTPMANDNIHADTQHHAECLRLINDLHDLLRLAESSQIELNTDSEVIRDAFEWKFWADQCADVLQIRVV
jgi:ribonuclease HI